MKDVLIISVIVIVFAFLCPYIIVFFLPNMGKLGTILSILIGFGLVYLCGPWGILLYIALCWLLSK